MAAPGARRVTDSGSARREFQADADAALENFIDGLSPAETALALAVLANRAVARLHNLARAEAAARRDQPEWPVWAQLQNAARTLVLQASTCRDLALKIAGRRQ
jgi:hypothetical protein